MRSLKSLTVLGCDLAERHGTTADYAARALRAYFTLLPDGWTIAKCRQCRAKSPIMRPSAGQRIIEDGVSFYPENLTLGEILAVERGL